VPLGHEKQDLIDFLTNKVINYK